MNNTARRTSRKALAAQAEAMVAESEAYMVLVVVDGEIRRADEFSYAELAERSVLVVAPHAPGAIHSASSLLRAHCK